MTGSCLPACLTSDRLVVPELDESLLRQVDDCSQRLRAQGFQAISLEYLRAMQLRLRILYERIARTLTQTTRSSQELCLCAVSKTVDIDAVCTAYLLGLRHFGENRPQELARKHDALRNLGIIPGKDLYFHQIGHLQRNKIKLVVSRACLIHSVDSVALARELSAYAVSQGRVQDILLQVNVSGEETKSGFSPAELRSCFGELTQLPSLAFRGLMTMAPRRNETGIQESFQGLFALSQELKVQQALRDELILSMGMSEDYEQALEAGAHIIRVGRSIFSQEGIK